MYHFATGTTHAKRNWIWYAADFFRLHTFLYPAYGRQSTWLALPPVVLPADKPAVLSLRVSYLGLGLLCSNNRLHVLVNDEELATFGIEDADFSLVPMSLGLAPWVGQPVVVMFRFDSHECMVVTSGELELDSVRISVSECP